MNLHKYIEGGNSSWKKKTVKKAKEATTKRNRIMQKKMQLGFSPRLWRGPGFISKGMV